jgi:hydroxymethylbilane synthase
VGTPDGARILRHVDSAPASEAEALGLRVADHLLEQGAAEILAAVLEIS